MKGIIKNGVEDHLELAKNSKSTIGTKPTSASTPFLKENRFTGESIPRDKKLKGMPTIRRSTPDEIRC